MLGLRSHRLLAAVLAVVLFSGGILPLVGYACAQAHRDRMMADCCKGHRPQDHSGKTGMASTGAPCPHHAGQRASAPDGQDAMTCCLLSLSTPRLLQATSAKLVAAPERHAVLTFVAPAHPVPVAERHVPETHRADFALHPTGPPLQLLHTVFLR